MRTHIIPALLTISLTVLSACYSPNITPGAQTCGVGGTCSEGYTCGPDNHCYKTGAVPSCPACNGATPICDFSTFKCVGCLADKDCGLGTICANKACVPGCKAAHPGCGADAGSCDVDLGVCRGCKDDAECTDPSNSKCDPETARCVPCLTTMGNDACPMGRYCDGSAGNYTCKPGCKNANDCTVGTPDGGVGTPMAACCNHVCTDTNSDSANCGSCGMACANGGACCGSTCIDYTSSVANCGGCGLACMPANVMNATCAASTCGYDACSAGFGDCNGNTGDGCETKTDTDVMNCGQCGHVCGAIPHSTPMCAAGACVLNPCDPGFFDCNMMPADGCEVDGRSDLKNCGACGNACPSLANSVATCIASTCGFNCTGGFGNCDKKAPNGCEVNLNTDPANCGTCGIGCVVANGTPACLSGKCAVATCNAGFADCDKLIPNGCEVNTQTDIKNCGGCGMACSLPNVVTPGCMAGACTVVTCAANTGNCDGKAANGCEVALLTDANNCGACGKVCPANNTCVNGVCQAQQGCNTAVLVIGDDQTQANADLATALTKAGLTPTVVANGSLNYAGMPAATNYGAVIVLIGNNYVSDMPAAGQMAIATAAAAKTGVVFTEWFAYEVSTTHYTTLAPLQLFSRSSGITMVQTYTSVVAHPIWTGLPNSFATVGALGGNMGNTLTNGGTMIATCTECANIGVAVRDNGMGRIVQMSFAADYQPVGAAVWTTDANTTLMMTNAAKWAARCL